MKNKTCQKGNGIQDYSVLSEVNIELTENLPNSVPQLKQSGITIEDVMERVSDHPIMINAISYSIQDIVYDLLKEKNLETKEIKAICDESLEYLKNLL